MASNFFDHNGLDWICRICGEVANHKKGVSETLRKNARYYHTVARCAQGLRSKPILFQNEAANRVTLEAVECYVKFTSFLDNTDLHEHGGTADRLATGSVVGPRSRSRSPPRKLQASDIGMGNDGTFDQYIGKRIVKFFMD